MKAPAAILAALLLCGAAQAQAQAQTKTRAAPICTDRPAKANSACTVPRATFQLETNALGWSRTETSAGRSETLTVAASVAKIGLTGRSDLQVGFTPFAQLTSRAAGGSDGVAGVGDVLVRYKHRLTREHAPVQVALIPSVKLPTAAGGLGNDRLEAGIAVPIGFALARSATMTLGPELNLLADADGDGRHLSLVNLVNLSAPLAPGWVIVGELWTNFNFDPAGTLEQVSADAALVHAVSHDLQVDIGTNIGLTADTPDVELYAGLSFRF
jgi:hypothetical protein